MGMRIHGGGGGYASGAQDAQWQQRRQNFDALAQAISGGNLSSAQAAYAQIQSSLPAGANANPNGFMSKVGAALQSGDISSAQQLLSVRLQGMGDQLANASTGATQAASSLEGADATAAATATSATSSTSSTAAASSSHGHRHHHHGGGGSSPALDLSQAIQSGDTTKAQSAMQTILADLQQGADMGSLASTGSTGATASSTVSSAVTAANNLLQNPDFQSLEAAVTAGDATAMQSAWSKLISGATDASSTASTTTTTTAPVATPVA